VVWPVRIHHPVLGRAAAGRLHLSLKLRFEVPGPRGRLIEALAEQVPRHPVGDLGAPVELNGAEAGLEGAREEPGFRATTGSFLAPAQAEGLAEAELAGDRREARLADEIGPTPGQLALGRLREAMEQQGGHGEPRHRIPQKLQALVVPGGELGLFVGVGPVGQGIEEQAPVLKDVPEARAHAVETLVEVVHGLRADELSSLDGADAPGLQGRTSAPRPHLLRPEPMRAANRRPAASGRPGLGLGAAASLFVLVAGGGSAFADPTLPIARDAEDPTPRPGRVEPVQDSREPADGRAGEGDAGVASPPDDTWGLVVDGEPLNFRRTAANSPGNRILRRIAWIARDGRNHRYRHQTKIRRAQGLYWWDCSGMASWLLDQEAPVARQGLFAERPTAEHFHDTIARSPSDRAWRGWQRIPRVADVMPGDLFAFRLPPEWETVNTGHVGFVIRPPRRVDRNRWLVRIADSTSYPHQDDVRVHGERTGFGFGTMLFEVDDEGAPRAYGWRGAESDRLVETGIAFGRVTR